MKRKLLPILTLVLALIGTMFAFAACGDKNDDKKAPSAAGEEVGEYYCDYNDSEYSLTLTNACKYTLTLGEDSINGSYKPNGEDLIFANGKANFLGTYFNDVVTLTYKNVSYTFLRKIEYTVTFQTDGDSAVQPIKVYNGRKLQKPADPTKAGMVFVGWYTDSAFKSAYKFGETVTSGFTLYARFVAPINPEFSVSFDLNGAQGAFEPIETVGHKAFNLPTPEWEGHNFLGWWVSHYDDASKLTYQYKEQILDKDVKLFAVWASDKVALSVEANEISWTSAGTNALYTLIITNASTGDELLRQQTNKTSYTDFKFDEQDGGEFKISIVVNNKTTECYYKGKSLAKVSVFSTTGRLLQFNAVEHAERYELTIECGKEGHHKGPIAISADSRSYNFSECDLKDGKIIFTVTAIGSGYLSSVSDPFVFSPVLNAVTGINVEVATETLRWTPVSEATSYDVVIKSGNEEIYSGNVVAANYSVKHLNKGTYTVTVAPRARGWNSPAPTTYTYDKSTLAAPSNIVANIADNKIEWSDVVGAVSYEVTIGSKTQTVTASEIEFGDTFLVSGVKDYVVTVRAIGTGSTKNSLLSDPITVRYGELGGELRYKDGALSWDPAFGITEYDLVINGGEATRYNNVASIPVNFEEAGEYSFELCAVSHAGDSENALSLTVNIYEIKFVAAGYGAVPSIFVAMGDKLTLPQGLTIYGYSLDDWYTEAGETGELYNDPTYQEERSRTLYAHWAPMTFHISLNSGVYGQATSEIQEGVDVRFGSQAQLPIPEPIDPDKSFAGWYDAAAGGVAYTNYNAIIERYQRGVDVTLYAHWVDILSFTLTADKKGYTVSQSPDIALSGITEITIPQYFKGLPVTEVVDFSGYTLLEVINIPDSIRTIVVGINESAFTGCTALRAINIYETDSNLVKYYSSDDGVLIYDNPSTGLRELKLYPINRVATTYDVPDGVQVIPSGVFFIPSGVYNTKLKELASISFPSSVRLIETMAVGSTYTSGNSVATIAFRTGNQNQALVMQDGAFYQIGNLTSLTLPANMQDFDFYSAFYLGSGETYSKFTTIEVIGTGAYSSSNNMILKYISASSGYELVLYPVNATTFTLPDDILITKIGKQAAYKGTKLTSITIPASITEIGENAFYGTTGVKTLNFAADESTGNTLSIGNNAFYSIGYSAGSWSTTVNLKTVVLPANLVYVGANAFGGTGIETVTVNSASATHTLEIANNAFSSVTTVNIGEFVKNVNFMSAFGSKLANVNLVPENHPYYVFDTNKEILFNKTQSEIVWIKNAASLSELNIPEGVTRISAGNFKDRTNLTKVTIPSTVTEIGNEAFSGCTGITQITFSAPAEGERDDLVIGNKAFYGCSKLASIDLPEGTTSLGSELFKGCKALTTVVLPTTLEHIATAAALNSYGDSVIGTVFGMFDDASASNAAKIASVTMHEGTPEHYMVKDNAIYLMKANKDSNGTACASELLYFAPYATTTSIEIPATVERIWMYAFHFATSATGKNLTTVAFEKPELDQKYDSDSNAMVARRLVVDARAFYNATSVTSITLPRGTVSIGEEAFYTCSGLTSFEVPNTVETIYPMAFYKCKTLTSLTFEDGGTAALRFSDTFTVDSNNYGIFGSTSSDIPNISSIVLPVRTNYIGDYAFYYSKFSSIAIPANVTYIGSHAFAADSYGTAPLVTVTFAPNSKVSYIGDYAFYNCKKLEQITIPASVTAIGISAFDGATKLTSVTFEDNSLLESLGDASDSFHRGVFQGCTALTTVDFGTGSHLKYIWSDTFANCTSLTEIVLPLSLVEIKDGAFNGAKGGPSGIQTVSFEESSEQKAKLHRIGDAFSGISSLKSFTFPESDTEIILPNNMFSGTALESVHVSGTVYDLKNALTGLTSLTDVTVSDSNPIYKADQAVLMNKTSGNVILVFGSLAGEYRVPDGTVEIGVGAFANSNIQSVYIPKSVTRILENAFSGCESLTSVTFEAGCVLETLGANAFSGCNGLAELDFRNTRITEIAAGAFAGCTALESVKFPATLTVLNATLAGTNIAAIDLSNTQLVALPDSMFANCAALSSISLPETLTTIGADVFANCVNITSFDFTGIESIGRGAFSGTGLTKVTLSGGITWPTTGSTKGVFEGCLSLKEVVFAASLPAAPAFSSSMFKGCTGLNKITFQQGTQVGAFGDYMFSGCTTLSSVKLPASITTFDISTTYYTFQNCTGLTSVDLSDCAAKSLYSNMFSGCTSLQTYKFPNTLEEIPSDFFKGNTLISSMTLPSSLKKLGSGAFQNCTALTSVDLSNTQITTIDYNAFNGCTVLSEVKLPSTLTTIGYAVFYNCTALEEITLPSSLTTINKSSSAGNGAFQGSGLTSIDLSGTKITSIADYAFASCTSLSTVTLPNTLTTIGSGAFYNCTSLEAITLPASFTTISAGSTGYSSKKGAFEDCTSLESVTLKSTKAVTLGDYAFKGCSELTTLNMSATTAAVTIGGYAFQNCSELATINMPTSIDSIGTYAFSGCSSLTSITLPSGLNDTAYSTKLGTYAFSGCSSLTSVNLSNTGVVSIADYLFQNCVNLETVTFPSTVTKFSTSAFNGCDKLKANEANWQNGVYYLGTLMYEFNAEKLEEAGAVVIKDGTTSIPANFFKNCTKLKSITIPTSVTAIGDSAFSGCSNLTSITLPANLTTIGSSAFESSGLTGTVTIPASVTSIGSSLFKNAKKVESVVINSTSGVTSVPASAFAGCDKLESVTLPSTVVTISAYAFQDCKALTSLSLNGVKTIYTYAFSGSGLTSIEIPASVTSIADYVFANCKSLATVKIVSTSASGITEIPQYAFQGCTDLTKVELSEESAKRITTINKYAFSGCSKLSNIATNDDGYALALFINLTKIDANAFEGCGLTKIAIPAKIGNYNFGDYVFQNNTQLVEVDYSKTTLNRVSANTFKGCTSLATVTFGSNIAYMYSNAFEGCTSLVTVDLSITTLTLINSSMFKGCTNLEEVILPDSVTSISSSAFENCSSLTTINIKEGTTIGSNAFKGTPLEGTV